MKTLEKVNIVSVLKISALIGLAFALVMSIMNYILVTLSNQKIASNPTAYASAGIAPTNPLMSSVSTLLIIWIFSIIFNVLSCVFYNMFAKWVGGVRYEDKEHIHVKKEEHAKKEEKK